jgi:hypothetical protein
MKELLAEFRKSFIRVAVLYFAIPAAVVCGAWLAFWRLAIAFSKNEPLEIAPGYKIKLP